MDIISFNEASTANGRIEKINANPDSTSGIVTVPKTIASGETVTIPAGRVAILPNVQIDGVLNIDGEVFIPSGSTFGDLDTQIALKADTSYVNTQLGLKANTADLKEIGVNQTWQDVTTSRLNNTNYPNTTGKPIFISCECAVTGTSLQATLIIDGLEAQGYIISGFTSNSVRQSVCGVIPDGSIYKVFTSGGILVWNELR